jgi:hypothetical protein
MSLLQLDREAWRRAFSRVLWNGPPLSGKTTGTLTLPRPCHLVVAPGEHGYSSVEPTDDYHIYAWDYDLQDPKSAAPRDMLKELRDTVTDVLTGKHGEVRSLVLDGLHKLYDLVMRVEGWTSAMVDDKEAGRQYTKYHDTFGTFLSRILGSAVPLVGATCYDGLEPVEPGSKQMQIFPLLPGRMAKDIMGMFPVVFHTERQTGGRFVWTLKPQGKMQAAGLHIPTRYAAAIPEQIEVRVDGKGVVTGGWQELEKILVRVGEQK